MHIVAGIFKHKKILTPQGLETRPTSERLRESLFNICQGYIEDASFLDLFAGSGAMGLEALSRGAKSATFVDNSRECMQCIKKNVENFNVKDKTHIFSSDVFDFLKRLSKKENAYDIVYVDPPYEMWNSTEEKAYSDLLMELLDSSSFITPGGVVFLEEALKAKPDVASLKSLELVSTRRLGRSILQEFRKKT